MQHPRRRRSDPKPHDDEQDIIGSRPEKPQEFVGPLFAGFDLTPASEPSKDDQPKNG